ncbi:phage baseplate assembly protein [Chromobacterium haemolyticum]|uniref:Phage baseplate assembly protein n=1 Tax=Chromobacterium fluminis TaxID=3044269 RepID=A0ABX0L854_9NEIS|nr:phage baseplate assembly protein V [Chromobacterium haemolyticum]NHR08002.1 phage baseplate assembly protein [Chromobacterium haemolyticum]
MSLSGMIARGRVLLANSASKLQALQIRLLAGETQDDVEHFEPFGLTAVPMADAEAIALFLGGDRSHGVVIAVGDRRYRVTDLTPGETAVYNAHGHKLVLYRDRAELLTPRFDVTANGGVFIKAPILNVSGQIRAGGEITDHAEGSGMSMAAMRGAYNGHDHNENNQAGGPTGKPNQGMR